MLFKCSKATAFCAASLQCGTTNLFFLNNPPKSTASCWSRCCRKSRSPLTPPRAPKSFQRRFVVHSPYHIIPHYNGTSLPPPPLLSASRATNQLSQYGKEASADIYGYRGRGGIRTHGRIAPTAVFKTASINHSDTLPSGNARTLPLPPGANKQNVAGRP